MFNIGNLTKTIYQKTVTGLLVLAMLVSLSALSFTPRTAEAGGMFHDPEGAEELFGSSFYCFVQGVVGCGVLILAVK